MAVFLRFDPPTEGVTDFAPRVEGKGSYIGERGYAVAMDTKGLIKVLWDDGGSDWCDPSELLFITGE